MSVESQPRWCSGLSCSPVEAATRVQIPVGAPIITPPSLPQWAILPCGGNPVYGAVGAIHASKEQSLRVAL